MAIPLCQEGFVHWEPGEPNVVVYEPGSRRGPALAIEGCPGSCWPDVYFEDAEMIAQLRPFVGKGTTFDFFGTIGCGSVEGCFLAIEGYEEAACGSTPADATSWGQLKAIYR